jgi:hypothetical protein
MKRVQLVFLQDELASGFPGFFGDFDWQRLLFSAAEFVNGGH